MFCGAMNLDASAMLHAIFNLIEGFRTPSFAVEMSRSRCSMPIQDMYTMIHFLARYDQKSNLHRPGRLLVARVEVANRAHFTF